MKKRKSKKQNRLFPYILLPVVWLALFCVGGTSSFFSDTETSTDNVLTAGSLDISVSATDWVPDNDLWLDESASRTLAVRNDGSLLANLGGSISILASSDMDFCAGLTLQVDQGAVNVYSGPLADFPMTPLSTLSPGASTSFIFTVTLPTSSGPFDGKACRFTTTFLARLVGAPDGPVGFYDYEMVDGVITDSKPIVIEDLGLELVAAPSKDFSIVSSSFDFDDIASGSADIDIVASGSADVLGEVASDSMEFESTQQESSTDEQSPAEDPAPDEESEEVIEESIEEVEEVIEEAIEETTEEVAEEVVVEEEVTTEPLSETVIETTIEPVIESAPIEAPAPEAPTEPAPAPEPAPEAPTATE